MTLSLVALATPSANSKKVRAAFFIISCILLFNADTVEMFSEVAIDIFIGCLRNRADRRFLFFVCLFSLRGSYSHFFKHVCDKWITFFFSDIPKSSVKFPKTQSLWSLAQAYPSIKHWCSIIFATLPFTERAEPILLDTRTRYTVATNWYMFTHIFFFVINFARKAGIDNTSYDAIGSL